jgi:uncharacterized protein with NAD-binding domain and iron-sulfur cluster
MKPRRQRVAILGGGLAGLACAWRLSEPGWKEDFESITVYQRGWRLGGKGASSRGPHGRIEEHGLHVWLGWYENAFRLLRECYEELDRPRNRPDAPVRTLWDAMVPAGQIGLADHNGGTWQPWVTDLPDNDERPGDPCRDGREMTLVDLATQAVRLVGRYFDVVNPRQTADGGGPLATIAGGLSVSAAAVGSEMLRMTGLANHSPYLGRHRSTGGEAARWRTQQGLALVMAAVRGIFGDRLLTDPRGLNAINDEEYLGWIRRHGGPPELADFAVVRSLYDMVFGFVDGDTDHPSVSAGTAVLFGGKTLFDYKGSIFWKMTAGMGDVVFAPLYEALKHRGVRFEFFSRVDRLHPSKDGKRIETIEVGRQARPARGHETYDPLVLCRGLPCFPSAPLVDQLSDAAGITDHPLESHWCSWPDSERHVLRDGPDFDVVVFAIPPGMAVFTCSALASQRAEWHDMLEGLGTVATQSFQLWLREPEPDLGWPDVGSTLSGFEEPFSTWASMPQLIEAEDWPEEDPPAAVAYFCGALDSPIPTDLGEAQVERSRVHDRAIDFLNNRIGHLLPGAVDDEGFRWDLLCGGRDLRGPDRFGSQYWTANIDPSDRYVQSLPGTDRFRLRSDESGYDNLFLAGDWTDSGLNAGCVEAAVLSGLQAANAVRKRPRRHEVAGYFIPER